MLVRCRRSSSEKEENFNNRVEHINNPTFGANEDSYHASRSSSPDVDRDGDSESHYASISPSSCKKYQVDLPKSCKKNTHTRAPANHYD